MPDQLQLRGGTTVQHSTFTGASKEVTVDTTKKTVVVHDGSTAGGNPMLREDGSNSALSLGSAGTPSLKYVGDSNTGTFSPAADTWAVSTGGTERLRIDSTGQIEAGGLGSAAAPTYSWFSDPDSGLYSPGANQVAISTGGSGRLFVDASGRLLIGTSSSVTVLVQAGLQVHGTGASSYVNSGRWVNDVTHSEYIFSKSRGANVGTRAAVQNDDGLGAVRFTGDDGTTFVTAAQITGLVDGTPGANDMPGRLIFSTTADGASTPTERMRIDSSGRVGIGTTSPGNPLDVFQAASGIVARFTGNGTTTTFNGFAVEATGTLNRHLRLISGGSQVFRVYESSTGNIATDGNIVFDSSTQIFRNSDGTTERARFDSSGRLLVGTSSARTTYLGAGVSAGLNVEAAGNLGAANRSISVVNGSASAADGDAILYLGRTRSNSIGGTTVVQNGDFIGRIAFVGSDGTDMLAAAQIRAEVDGTPGTNDMPGRIVLATTLDGASAPTEALRITNDRVIGYNQAAPVAVDATATLTVANLKNGIITSTTAAAVTGTLPTGTLTEGGFSGLYTNFTFQWTVINTGATNNFTVAAGTDHTVVGNMVVAAGNSGRFATRRTAANTFVTYRLSS